MRLIDIKEKLDLTVLSGESNLESVEASRGYVSDLMSDVIAIAGGDRSTVDVARVGHFNGRRRKSRAPHFPLRGDRGAVHRRGD